MSKSIEDAADIISQQNALIEELQAKLAAQAAPVVAASELTDEQAKFTAWLAREMPAGTVISDPAWWAPRILRAVLAQAAPVAVPDGWKLVPVEPTEIMYIRGEEEMTHGYDLEDDTTAGARDRAELIGSIYKAMLDAAPAAPVAAAVPAGWVSVDERRPTDHTKKYLVFSNWGIRMAHLHEPVWADGVFQDTDSNSDEGMSEWDQEKGPFTVTHWCELPAAPAQETAS